MICGLFDSRSVYPEELSMVECELQKMLWFVDRCCVAGCVYVVDIPHLGSDQREGQDHPKGG